MCYTEIRRVVSKGKSRFSFNDGVEEACLYTETSLILTIGVGRASRNTSISWVISIETRNEWTFFDAFHGTWVSVSNSHIPINSYIGTGSTSSSRIISEEVRVRLTINRTVTSNRVCEVRLWTTCYTSSRCVQGKIAIEDTRRYANRYISWGIEITIKTRDFRASSYTKRSRRISEFRDGIITDIYTKIQMCFCEGTSRAFLQAQSCCIFSKGSIRAFRNAFSCKVITKSRWRTDVHTDRCNPISESILIASAVCNASTGKAIGITSRRANRHACTCIVLSKQYRSLDRTREIANLIPSIEIRILRAFIHT